MQTSEMDRKREAFLEHLKYKYPHHATAIMGHQERLRDQTKSPKLSSSPQPSVGDPAEHLSEASADSGDMMFEADSAVPFVRGSRTRASLPVVRSTNQTKERSLGTLFLQYGDDTKKMQMPNEITSVDTIRALFVSAFPQQLTMKILESPSTAIYIKDEGRNVYYELSDVRNIQDRCFLKVYNKDPAHAFNHTRGAVNGDVRMQRDISYSVREGPAIHRPGSATYPSHAGPVSPPPTPVPHSMPSSPSRIPYGGGRPAVVQSNTMQRERIPSVPAPRSISPSPSAILERRDVKPDEDMGNKNVQLLRNDSIYQDPYLYHEGRMSMASSHGGHPLDVPDHIIAYHRGSLRSASTYSNSSMQMEMMEQSMYRQKSRKHVESHLPTLGSKTPPTSPHRVADIRMMEMHAHNAHLPPHGMQADRSSPLRQSFKKEQGPGMFVEAKVRNTGGIMGMADIVPSPTDKQVFGGYGVAVPPKDPYTRERMHAMEKQIASLTGLVQTALLKGPSPNNSAPSDRVLKSANGSASSSDRPGNQGVAAAKNSLAISETITVINQQSSTCSQEMHVSLQDMRRNVAELRLQLHKMRQLQLQNQETVRLMMKKAEMEISSKVTEMVKGLEDPVQRQRVLVEQERQKYLGDEEQIVAKLCDLEDFVESLKKDQSTSQRSITLKDVEDRAFMLRQIGEAVSNLKGEFPYLQNKMRAVLRVEVEAVRFLKEEPHKLDSLLKRIRNMTDALSALRRHATDGSSKSIDNNQTSQVLITERVTETDSLQVHEEKSQVYLQPTQTDGGAAVESPTTSVKSEVVPLSAGLRVHQVQSSPVLMQQSQHSSALVNHTPAPSTQSSHSTELLVSHQTASVPPSVTPESARRNPPTAAQEGSSKQSLFIEEMSQVTYRNRAVSIEEAERKFEEKRQNLDHYNGKEFEKMLEEAQASIMKAIPSLEVPAQSQKVEIVDKKEVTEVKTIMEQDNDKVTKSPPPPPPRRMYPPGSGLNSVWTAESTFLVRKDSSKDSEEALPKVPSKAETEEPHLQSVEATVKSSAVKDEDEEEEGARIMAELQVSKEGLNAEKPEEKWKIQNPASESAKIRQGDTVIVNETFSLFTGREKYGECQTDKEILPAQECEKGDGSPLVSPAILEKRLISFSTSKETESGIPQPKREVLNVKVGEILHVEKKEEVLESHMTALKSLNEHEMPYMDMGQTVVLRPKSSRRSLSQQQSDDSNSPTTSPTETTSPADNIAFMITKTKVQVLSTGEVQDIVSRKGEDVQTFNIDRGNNEKILSGNLENIGSEDPVVCTDKKPVIIIFDEPMDIKSAYKRLSTIFEEGDDDLEKHMSEAKIEEEDEEEEAEVPSPQESKKELPMEHTTKASSENPGLENKYRFNYPTLAEMKKTIFEDANAIQTHFTDEDRSEASDDQLGQRQDVKKKFKFKFPKKQLAALTQAIRTGTKTGKKTLQVVVYEEEEEADGTIKQHKEAKRFEIARSSSKEDNAKYGTEAEAVGLETDVQVSRTDEIKRTTYKILDSLEQTIKQQENLISEMAPIIGAEALESREKCKVSSDIKTGAAEPVEEPKPVVETPSSIPTAARKGSSGGAQTSRMPIPMSSKSRQANVDKSSKQPKLQEPQRQYRQANGGTKKAGGDVKASAPSLSVSKIPGLSSNTGKSGSVPAQSSETSNPPNPSVKSHVANSNPQASRTANPSALVRPAHNGSSKLQPPPTYKGHHLSFSPQASNGRPALPSTTASSSSPPSSVSPTSLTQGVKSIRTIHTPSFTSYKSQNGSASKGLNAKETS